MQYQIDKKFGFALPLCKKKQKDVKVKWWVWSKLHAEMRFWAGFYRKLAVEQKFSRRASWDTTSESSVLLKCIYMCPSHPCWKCFPSTDRAELLKSTHDSLCISHSLYKERSDVREEDI